MEFRRYLPSKRFAFFVISVAIAALCIVLASYIGAGKPLSSAFAVISNVSIGGKAAVGDTDSDNDGLPDWEEGVRGTDPQKADTDGDGTKDSDEIKLNRDPKKAGPDDSLADEESQKFLNELLAAASSSNLTDNLSQTIFARYVAARGEGTSGDVQTQAKVVQEAVNGAEVPYKGKVYGPSDIYVVSNNNVAVRTFANASMQAILKHPDANFVKAMQAFGEGMDGSPAGIQRLRYIGSQYRAMARDMASVSVPSSYAEHYLLAINALEIAGGSFDDMAEVNNDPIRAVAGLQNYNRMITGGAGALVLVGLDVWHSGLTFSKDEVGGGWGSFAALSSQS